ncbi:hypothetical protein, partial [Roseomonas mucosa]|uniref:hypothetical protein n=1 Tax=Roseomonas mucosa TaxID=207340 RepID=UPI0028CD9309
DRSRSEVLCTHGGQPSELVQSPSENDSSATVAELLTSATNQRATHPFRGLTYISFPTAPETLLSILTQAALNKIANV